MVYTTVAIVYGITKWPEGDRPLSSLFGCSMRTSFVKIDEPDIKKLTAEIRHSVASNFRCKGGKVGVDDVAMTVENELSKSAIVSGGVRKSADTQPRYAVTVYNASMPPVIFRSKNLKRRDFYAPERKGIRLLENLIDADFHSYNHDYNLFYLIETEGYVCSIVKHCMRMRKKERNFKVLVNPVYDTYKQFLSFNKS